MSGGGPARLVRVRDRRGTAAILTLYACSEAMPLSINLLVCTEHKESSRKVIHGNVLKMSDAASA